MKKIYLAHSRDPRFDYQRDFYLPFIKNFRDIEIIVPHDNYAESSFNSKLVIATCDFLIAEVSYPSTGLGMELAWAEAANIPVLCLYKNDTLPSSSVFNLCNDVNRYHAPLDYINTVKNWLRIHE